MFALYSSKVEVISRIASRNLISSVVSRQEPSYKYPYDARCALIRPAKDMYVAVESIWAVWGRDEKY